MKTKPKKPKKLHPIFAAFCGKNPNYRTYGGRELHLPFVQGGYVYATDGSIAVRQPTTEPERGNGPPEAVRVFVGSWEQTPTPLPKGSFGPRKCPHCSRSKKKDECYREGCDKGMIPNEKPVLLDGYGYALQAQHVHLLRSFGVKEVFLPSDIFSCPRPLRFVIGDIEGLVMPKRMGDE